MDRQLVSIFLLLFVLYLTGTRFCMDGYELEYVLSAMNVYNGNGPSMAAGFEGCPGISDTTGDKPIYPRQNLLQTYLSVPFYAVGALLFGEEPTISDRGKYWDLPWGPVVLISLMNPLLAALTAILVALIALNLGISSPNHYCLALLFGLSTMMWHYAGLGMEVLQTAVLTATVWGAIRFRFTGKLKFLIITLILILALPNCKKHSAIFVLPLLIYLIWSIYRHSPEKANRIVLAVSTVGLLGTLIMMGSMIMRFRADPNLFSHLLGSLLSGGFKSIDLIFGLTLSPGEGLLVFNPLLWFAIPAWGVFYRKHKAEALLFMGLSGILLIVLWRIPYVLIDEEWGPRYLLVILPLMFVAGASGILKRRTRTMKTIFIVVLIISILINWVSSLYLGFKVLDAALSMGISDYFSLVFTPSLSQIWLALTCFISHLNWIFTGHHLELTHKEFSGYTGIGGQNVILRQDLDSYDYPSGGVFVIRWVLSESGIHFLTPKLALLFKLLTDFILLGLASIFLFRRLDSFTEQVQKI
ncbi:hypothetical protein K8T06_04620 [bacterium]|nr:hypothetical protein [bacterium]